MNVPSNNASSVDQNDTVPVPTNARERIIWWVVFGVLVLSIVVMLGAWN